MWTPNLDEALYFLGVGVAVAEAVGLGVGVSDNTSAQIRLPITIRACPPVGLSSILNHTSPSPLHSPENNHVTSVPSHSNTRPAHPKAAIRIPRSAGPTHPMVSVPSFMIAFRLLVPIGVASAARGGLEPD